MDSESQTKQIEQSSINTDSKSPTKSQTQDTNKQSNVLEHFTKFHLKDFVLRGIREAGFQRPSPVQEQSIPIILEGRDLIAQAQTGTGKTAAFAIPILNALKRKNVQR